MDLNRDQLRNLTRMSLGSELDKVLNNYMKVYDEYYDTCSRPSAHLKDLVDGILGISAVLEVYTRDGKIYPDYAIEKLNHTLSIINSVKSYFESQIESQNEESDN